jgi:enediyne biosynthesis protein E4
MFLCSSRRGWLHAIAWLTLTTSCFVLLAQTGCGPTATTPQTSLAIMRSTEQFSDTGPDLFADVTADSGINFQYRNGEEVDPPHMSILESLGGGLAVIDFDGDGLHDLFLVGGGHFGGKDNKQILGHPCKLFKNQGNFKFVDVTEAAGLNTLADGQPWFYSHGAAIADYDRDGWPDILVTGWGRIVLLHNEPDGKNGRRFVDVSKKAGMEQGVTWTTSAAWADFDGDGYPDFYACQYVNWGFESPNLHPVDCTYTNNVRDVCPPKKFSGLKHLMFQNKGDGTFQNVTTAAGIVDGGPSASKGLGVVVADLNADGKPDIYVANDTVPNFLYMNQSKLGSIQLVEQGMKAGVAVDGFASPNGSMGTDAGDPDGSGKPSLFCTNYENELHALYENKSTPERPFFVFVTPKSGMAALGQKYVGWGTGFVDLDHDGWEDLFIANGHAIRFPQTAERSQKPVILRNKGQGKFLVASSRGGSYFTKPHLGRGIVLADFDNDGRVDIAIMNVNEQMAILKNVAPAGNHWLGVSLVGAKQADVVGAKVKLTAGTRTQSRFAKGGGSYASSPDRRLVFGLGEAGKVAKLVVDWPDGTSQEFDTVPVDRYVRISQGEKQFEEIGVKK